MAVATQMRPKTKTGQWSSIFPPDQVTQQQSAIFVKKLLAVAVSTVTYLRHIFPEHAFGDRSLEDMNLKILRDDSACPGACQVIKWMKGAFEALDKRYLRAMVIGIYTDPSDPNTAIETYTFKFSYSQSGPDVDMYRNEEKMVGAKTEAQTKKATKQLLRTIIVLNQSLRLLPDDVMMTMKLLYYDDVTPVDYEPPGFRASDTDSFSYEDNPINLRVGEVATPFHTVKLRITTDRKQFDMEGDGKEEKEEVENADGEEMVGEKKDQEDEEMEDLEQVEVGTVEKEKGPKTAEDVPNSSPNIPGTTDEASQNSKTAEEEENIPQCACGCNEDDGLMIQCEMCCYWQHAVCFKITAEEDVPERHYCNQCGKIGDPECGPTDPSLSGLDSCQVRETCLWRRALEAVTDMGQVTAPSFAKRLGVETGVAQGLITRLLREGYCSSAGKKKFAKVVNRNKLLTHGFQKYLNRETQCESPVEPMKVKGPSQESPAIVETLVEKKNRSSLQRKKSQKSEVDKLTEQAADLNVSGQLRRSGRISGSSTPLQIEELPKERKSEKRTACSMDGKHDFELSCSQEQDSGRVRKRRKSSIVNNPILA